MQFREGLLCACMCLSFSLASAEETRFLSGRVHEAGERQTPVPGAVVTLCHGRDTLRTLTGASGFFLFKNPPVGVCTLTVSMMGFQPHVRVWRPVPYESLDITLKEARYRLKAAAVTGSKPVYEVIGDTLKYHVAATQQVGEDEMLGDVLGRLPGVETDGDVLKVMGEHITKIYVDGRLLFGDRPSDALRYLAGTEVVSLKVYEQMSRSDGAVRRKERVANVETRSKMTWVLVAHAVAAGGSNFKRSGGADDFRYQAGLAGNYFSEMRLFSANLYLNNLGIGNSYRALTPLEGVSPLYRRVGYAGAELQRKFGSPEHGSKLLASYSYMQERMRNESRTQRSYAPSDLFAARTVSNAYRNLSGSGTHHAHVSYASARRYIPFMDLSFQAEDSWNRIRSSNLQRTDGVDFGLGQYEKSDRRRWEGRAELSKGLMSGPFSAHIKLNVQGGRENGSWVRRDTTLEGGAVTSWLSDPLGDRLAAEADARLMWHPGGDDGRTTWDLSYEGRLNREMRRTYRYRDAVAEANLDTLTSEAHTWHYHIHCVRAGVSWKAGPFELVPRLALQRAVQYLEQPLLGGGEEHRRYDALMPSFQLSWRPGPFHTLAFVGTMTPVLPSAQQVTSRLDDSSPLFLKTGNPTLRQTKNWNTSLIGNFLLGKGQTLGFRLSGNWLQDQIVQRTDFFPSGTELRGHEIPAGASLLSYDHADGALQGAAMVLWQAPLRKLSGSLSLRGGADFYRSPSLVDGRRVLTFRQEPYLHPDLRIRISRNHSLKILSDSRFSLVRSSRYEAVDYLTQRLALESVNRFGKRFFLNGSYGWTARVPLQGRMDRRDVHTLNAVGGVRLLPSRSLELSVAAYDLLGQSTSWKTRVLENFVETRYTPYMGRIWMISLCWRFNSSQRGKSSAGRTRFSGEAPNLGEDYEKHRFRTVY